MIVVGSASADVWDTETGRNAATGFLLARA